MKRNCSVSMLSGCALLAACLNPLQAAPAELSSVPCARPLCARPLCTKPRGMKVRVRSFFTVTNSDDGFRDHTVEVYGQVSFSGQQVWRVTRDNARSIDNKPNPNYPDVMTTGPQNNEIDTSSRTFDVIFDSSSTWNLIVTGYLNDRDKGVLNKDDAMWNPFKIPQVVNLKQMSEGFKKIGDASGRTIPGDHDSESADLRVVVSKVGDIY